MDNLLQLNILRIGRQFELFQEYQERVSEIIGSDKTQQLVNGALVLMTLGGNDFVNNYFFPISTRRRQSSLGEFSQLLISEYKKILVVSFLGLQVYFIFYWYHQVLMLLFLMWCDTEAI